ncbi:crossover junction endonuclease EME1 [Polypterus senegalus]|uniref:crossover junction endonuclease EME1 n=1 Tax=Polypterus senegalus TaxID=55291 RepID=UPI001966733D|nr:crossover junction endonuclease EME1 [Polypterus senegalus]
MNSEQDQPQCSAPGPDGDGEDLPVFTFLQKQLALAHENAAPELLVLESSDSDSSCCFPVGTLQDPLKPTEDVTMISSESDDEDVYVPLSERLKERFGAKDADVCGPLDTPLQSDNAELQNQSENFAQSLNKNNEQVTGAVRQTHMVGKASVWDISDSEDEAGTLRLMEGPGPSSTSAGKPPFTGLKSGLSSPVKKRLVKCNQEEVEEKRLLTLQKKKEREKQRAERETKKHEIERERAKKKALAEAVRAMKPEECIKNLLVDLLVAIDPALLQVEGGGQLLTLLQSLNYNYVVESQAVPCSVTWKRRTHLTEAGETQYASEANVVVLVPTEDFISMILCSSEERQGISTSGRQSLKSWARKILEHFGKKTLTVAVVNLETYFRSQKCQSQRRFREEVLGDGDAGSKRRKRKAGEDVLPKVSRVEVEEALVDLQLLTDVQVHLSESWKAFSDYVAMVSKAVAETPFKRQRDQASFNFYLDGEWAGGCKVDRNGRGLLQVWKRQIQQFNRVSPEIASAILAAFPSPQSLVKAYRKCSSEAERQRLLADVQVRRGEGVTATSRRIGPELSKRVYLLLTSCDPELSLEAAG